MTDLKLKPQLLIQGWEQFLTGRENILDEFNKAVKQGKSHKVKTQHGKVAEAVFRRWLSEFLPRKYGVTSGYIISQGLSDTDETPHFDVIIYDQSESPILWVESNPDLTENGRSRAIPVEYVYCVLEVKSTFSPETVGQSLQQIANLAPFLKDYDKSDEQYKRYLPRDFCSGLVFFKLPKKHEFSKSAIDKIAQFQFPNFFGGLILSGEGNTLPKSALIKLLTHTMPIDNQKGRISLLRGFPLSSSILIEADKYSSVSLSWSESNFSIFAFNLIAMMQGKYNPGRLASFYGLGGTSIET